MNAVRGRTTGLAGGDITFSGNWTGYVEMKRKGEDPQKLLREAAKKIILMTVSLKREGGGVMGRQ